MVQLSFYGGVGEIGGNKFLADFDGTRVFLDFGLSFSGMDRYFEEFLQPRSHSKLHDLLQLDLLPPLPGIYRQDALRPAGLPADHLTAPLWESGVESFEAHVERTGRPGVDGVLLSHGHEDHCLMSAFLGPVPFHCSGETRTLLETACEIGHLTGFDSELVATKVRQLTESKGGYVPGAEKIASSDPEPRPYSLLEDGRRFQIGRSPEVEAEALSVGHSVPGATAFLLEGQGQTLLYTGDIRFHGRYGRDLRDDLQGLRPDVLLVEGTRIEEEAVHSETALEAQLSGLLEGTEGLALVGFRWKDVERYETVRTAAQRAGRTLIVDPRAAYLLHALGRNPYDEGVGVFLDRIQSMLYSPADYTHQKYRAGFSNDWKAGEPDWTHLDRGTSALAIREDPTAYVVQLDLYRFNRLPDIRPPPGSTFVAAHTEPFKEEMRISEERLHHWLEHYEINPPDHRPVYVHASGHASRTEIKELIDALEPRAIVPIHTEKPEAFRDLAENVCFPRLRASVSL